MIVNQAQTDEAKLKSVLRAVERDIDIDLADEYHLDDWLDDVVLRFERSRHLSADQKQKYYDSVRKISDEIHVKNNRKPRPEIPRKYEPILANLKAAIESNEKAQAMVSAEELERVLSQRERGQDPLLNVFDLYRRMYQRSPLTFFVILTAATAFYVYFVYKFLHQ